MKEKLYAFWPHTFENLRGFPGALGGEVHEMNDSGRVYVRSYLAWFRPSRVMPLEAGKALHAKIEALRKEYDAAMKRTNAEYERKFNALFKEG